MILRQMAEISTTRNKLFIFQVPLLALLHFYSYASFPALKEEVTNTWTKDQSNNDTCRHVLDFQGDLNGTGMFSCRNGDYFEGQFRGSLYDRTGHLTKPREAGCYTVGKV